VADADDELFGDLEDWFEDFNHPEPRDRYRGFRR
jgi:hypothetical protein